MALIIDPFTMRLSRRGSIFPAPPAAVNVSFLRSETSSSAASYTADDASGGVASHEVYYSDGGDWTLADTFAPGVAIAGSLSGLTAATAYQLYVKSLAYGKFTDSEIANATTRTTLVDGLVEWWTLNSDGAGSLNAHNGTLVNSPTFVSGKVGNCLQAATSGNRQITVADHANIRGGNRDFTIFLWFYVDGGTGSVAFIGKNGDGTNREFSLNFGSSANEGQVTFFTHTGSGGTVASSAATAIGACARDTWYFAECGFNATSGKAFLRINNGTLLEGGTGTPGTTTNVMSMGSAFTNSASNVRVDEVARYNRLSTATDRATYYAAGAGIGYSAA